MPVTVHSLISRASGRLTREYTRRCLSRRIRAGPGTYFGLPLPRVTVYPGDPSHMVTFGAYCSVAGNLELMIGGEHDTRSISTYPFETQRSKGPITVGNDVWIGKNVLILSGVTIGDGAVIGAGSVVARAVRPFAVVAGSPIRDLRRRFDDAEVERLLAIAWWTWPDHEVRSISHLILITSRDIDALEAYAAARAARRSGVPITR